MTATTSNGTSNGWTSTITIQQLAIELEIDIETAKQALMMPKAAPDAPVTSKKAEQMRRSYASLKNPVMASLVASDALSAEEKKENVVDLSTSLKAPQKMVTAIANEIFQQRVQSLYNDTLILELTKEKAKKDAAARIEKAEVSAKVDEFAASLEAIDGQKAQLEQIESYLTNYVSPGRQEVDKKLLDVYNQIQAKAKEKEEFLKRVAEGYTPTAEEERNFFF